MKRKDITALHDKTEKELNKMQQELQLQLAKSRMEKKAGKLENISLVKTLADDVARIKTVIREKQLADRQAAKVAKEAKETKE
jgi:ribosomal protein L29